MSNEPRMMFPHRLIRYRGKTKPDGVYRKFQVKRTDGGHRKGMKHEHCQYFVLDITHDPYAVAALKAYAKACKKELPALAADLERTLDSSVL